MMDMGYDDEGEVHVRSLTPSHIPSCSAFLSPVMRLVLPHRMKSASFSWPMNACLHASALGDNSSLSVGGEARCKMSWSGVVWEVEAPCGMVRMLDEMMWLS